MLSFKRLVETKFLRTTVTEERDACNMALCMIAKE